MPFNIPGEGAPPGALVLPKDEAPAPPKDFIRDEPPAPPAGTPKDEPSAGPKGSPGQEVIPFSSLTPEERLDIQNQLSQPEPEGVDMVSTLSPQELAEAFHQKVFNPDAWAAAHPDAPPDQLDKVADTLALIKARGAKFSDIDLKEAGKSLLAIFPGAAKYTGRALEVGMVEPVARAVLPKLKGGAQEELDAIQAAKSAELVASTESGLFGIGTLAKKAAHLAGRQVGKILPDAVRDFIFLPSFSSKFLKNPLDKTPQERRDDLFDAAGDYVQRENIAKGHGAVTGTLLAGPIKDLEAKGYKIDPTAVEAMAAGDPITFYAFGKGFRVAVATAGAAVKVVANVASRSEAGALVNALRVAQQAAAKAGAEASKASNAAGAGLEAEVAQAAKIGETAFPGQAGVLTAEATPGLSAALDTAAETAAAARAAEIAARNAGEAVAASPTARALTVAGKLPAAVVEAREKVAAALSGAVERGVDIAASAAPGITGVGLKAASWVANIAGSHPLAAYAIAGGGTAGLGGAGAATIGKAYAPTLAKIGAGATEAAKQLVKGDVSKYGSTAAAISSAAQMFPAIAGGAARGAIIDAALAAATSETSEDMVHAPMFMTAHGALKGANLGILSGVQRQLIGERDIQSATRTANRPYGDFGVLDEANRFTVEQLAKDQPDKVRRLSAIRDFLSPSGTQMYWIPEAGEIVKVLKQLKPGLEDTRYAEMAAQRALNIEVDGKNISIVKDLDAAPHEAVHNWQSVMSAEAMDVIDQITYDAYAPYWDSIGENYVRKFFNADYLAALKARGESWREAVVDLATGKTDWRGQLSPEELEAFSNQYVAREISAEVGDTLIKNGGPELLKDKSYAGKIARVIAKTYSGMGLEPFEGARTEGQNVPLQFETTEKIRKALKGGIEEFKVESARPDLTKPAAAVPSPVGIPKRATPATTAANPAEKTREISATAPETPTVRGGRTQRAIATDIADAIDAGTGLSVDYMSAPGEPAGAITSNREARRAIIEAFRNMPTTARTLWEKTFFPDQLVRAGSKIQVMGWSPEVFAANAHKLAAAIAAKPGGVAFPYELDKKTGTFTERGWKELYVDTTNFVKNQRAGLTGSGEPLVVPAEVVEKGFTPPRVEGKAGAPVDQRKADIISALFGVPIPKTPRIGKVYPRNLAGQEVSEATKPGRVSVPVEPRAPFAGKAAEEMGVAGRTIQEVNPFRAELEAAGIKPSFIEALQRLNLENIADVSKLPAGTAEVRGREFTLQAGFQPKEDEPRAVKEAAVQLKNGKVFTGAWHGEAIDNFRKAFPSMSDEAFNNTLQNELVDGFVTNGGEFLTREEAFNRAVELQQISEPVAEDLSKVYKGKKGAYLESDVFRGVAKFQGGREEADRLAALSPSEFVKEIRAAKRPMTLQSYDLGKQISLDDLPTLREHEAAARAKWKEAMTAKDMTEAVAASSQKQFFTEAIRYREALEAAKGITDPEQLREIEREFGVGDLVPKEEILKATFQPGDKGFIGAVNEDGEVTAEWADLSKTTHERLGMRGPGDLGFGAGNWRYNPENKIVYWWGDNFQDSGNTEMVDAWLDRKGYEVKRHVNIESSPARYARAHGVKNINDATFAPKKEKIKPGEELKLKPTSGSPSKAWIMPDGTPVQLGAQWHEAWLRDNPDVTKKYGIKITDEADESNRPLAMQKGFARVNYEPRNGKMTVEARAKDWRKLKNTVSDMAEANLDSIDKIEIHVLDEAASDTPVDAVYGNLFQENTRAEKLAKLQDTLDAVKTEEIAPAKSPKGPSNIAIARARFQPRGETEALPGFDLPRERLSTREISSMTRQELREHFPEAVVPRVNDEPVPSEILKSPLYKKSKDKDSAVKAFADRLVEFANEYKDDPAFEIGAKWYSEFTPRLKKEFGKDAPIMAELLAATSPQTPPDTNFGYAFDALQSLRSGRFDKILPKFNQGLEKMEDGSWEPWLKRNAPDAPATPASFLARWIEKYNLKPTQSNGKLYGQHSLPVLKVFARRWLELSAGPKTKNFVENLLGKSDEATIDLWADRTMRWAGYEGFQDRWRILPENKHSVADDDFAFAQETFREAAKRMKMKPSELQGALWFAEKKRWADAGWGRLDLGNFQTEMDKIPALKSGFKHRIELAKAKKKVKEIEQPTLDILPRFK